MSATVRNRAGRPAPWARGSSASGSSLAAALHLFGLVGLVVAQPIYDLLGRHAAFLVAHTARGSDILGLVLTLSVGLPAALLGAEMAAATASPRMAMWLHRSVVATLSGLFALQLIRRGELVPGLLLVAAAGLIGLAGSWLYSTRSVVRQFVSVLSPAAMVFPLVFVFATPVATLIAPAQAEYRPVSSGGPVSPAILIVFDEFSLASLLDHDEQIDADLYPGFAALAGRSHWFRNATTVSTDTVYAVPAILSGRYPDRRRLATAAEYPDTLLTLLGRSHDLRVFECVTDLCPETLCGRRASPPLGERLHSLLDDVGHLYPHLVLPKDLGERLAPVSSTWRDFGARAQPGADAVAAGAARSTGGSAAFTAFLEAVGDGDRRAFYFHHLLLPHWPWKYLPNGREYGPIGGEVAGWHEQVPLDPGRGRGYYWGDDQWSLQQAQQRYLLQVGFVDGLIREFLATLERVGLLDSSLVVVVADHGVSFRPGSGRKQITEIGSPGFAEIVNVPLFVKLPGQVHGVVSERNVQTVDLLPTVAEVLGLEVPWPVDGRSVFNGEVDDAKRVVNSLDQDEAGPYEYTTGDLLAGRRQAVASHVALFSDLQGRPDVFAIGPRPELRGRAVGELAAPPTEKLRVEHDDPLELVDRYHPGSGFSPVHVTGRLVQDELGRAPVTLAVAVNGVVHATTWSYQRFGEAGLFSALLPESAFAVGGNRVEVLLVDDRDGRTVLRPIPRAAVGSRYTLVTAAGEARVEAAEGSFPIVDGEVAGGIDRIVPRTTSGWATVTGWAVDLHAGAAAAQVVVFADGELVAATATGGARPELAEELANPALLHAGFSLTVPGSLFPSRAPYPELRVIAVSVRGVASDLRLPPAVAVRLDSPSAGDGGAGRSPSE